MKAPVLGLLVLFAAPLMEARVVRLPCAKAADRMLV